MSAPFRYARILNGFSSLISRRSAISRRMRAMAGLSNPEPFPLDAPVEHAGAGRGEGGGDRRLCGRGSVAKQTAAPASSAHLGRRRPGLGGAFDELVDGRRRDTGGKSLSVGPFVGDLATDLVPVGSLERATHRNGRVPDALEAVEYLAIAVDMALHDFPIVRPGISWRSRVGQDDTPLQLGRSDVERPPPASVGPEPARRDPAVQSGPVILDTGWHLEDLTFDVHGYLQDIGCQSRRIRPLGEGATGGDGKGRRSSYTGAGRGLAAGG